MKSVKSIFIAALTLVSVATVGQDLKAKYNTDDSKIALQGYSPVSYLDLGIAQKGVKDYKSGFDGLNYYFTSKEQKRQFDANPEKYLPQYGGYCAFGVSVGAKFRVDPNKFVVRDGRYFLYLYDIEVDAQLLWLQGNHDQLMSKADNNWRKLNKSR